MQPQPYPLVIQQALAMNQGARWTRAALQVNPFAYHGANSPSRSYQDETAYNAAIVARCLDMDVGMIAVTDHWNAETAVGLLAACEEAGIRALPGFEATASNGAHALVIFPEHTQLASINAAIGACLTEPGASGPCRLPFDQLASEMTQRGALVIAAHVNAGSGLMTVATGQALGLIWRSEQVHAAAVSPGQELTPAQQRVLDNRDPDTQRQHALAIVHGDDINHPDRLAQEGGTCWIKMSEPTWAGLATALRAPATRIALADPASRPHPYIRAVAWEGGFLGGLRLPLSESLTTLIGGRGTGKSTVIESIRFALDLPAIGETTRRDHANVVSKVLTEATTVTLLVTGAGPERADFIISRTVPHPPVVEDLAGTVLALSPLDVLGPVEILGQQELSELAEDKGYVARLIERFAGSDNDDRSAALRKRLAINRGDLLRLRGEAEALRDALADLPRLREKRAQFEQAGVASRAQEQRQVQIEVHVLTEVDRNVTAVDELLSPLLELTAPVLDEETLSAAGPERSALVSQAQAALAALHSQARQSADALKQEILSAQVALVSLRQSWDSAVQPVIDQYRELAQLLQAQGLDVAAYLRLDGTIRDLAAQEATLARLDGDIADLAAERRRLLADLAAASTARYRRLGEACTEANRKLQGFVIVKPQYSLDRTDLKDVLRALPGQKGQINAALEQPSFSPQAFVKACRTGASALAAQYEIRGAQAAALAGADEGVLLELEEHTVGLAAEAQLNTVAAGSSYKSLDELSKGQKATALLLLLLAEAQTPLLIDQPEDNLDNRFVYDGVVPRLRAVKGSRQILFATHNANVPVLGDAELVVAMDCQDGRGCISEGGIGSLDHPEVRKLAGDVLEGGRDAFAARQHLYGY